jgi:hypothetical protein
MKNFTPFFYLGLFLFSHNLKAITTDPALIAEQLNSAQLVADISIKSLTPIAEPKLFVKTIATAQILNKHKSILETDLYQGDEIEIEFIGGEIDQRGVMFSGLPRPRNGVSYKAYLNRLNSNSNRFAVTGFEQGLQPLYPLRQYSRNRTDGSNGSGTGPFLYWDKRYFPIPYYISAPSFSGRPDFVTSIETSFKTWRVFDDVLVEFISFGCNQSTKNENDNLNTIVLLTEDWPFDNAAIAVTRNFYVAGEEANAGMILDSDILLNGKNFSFTTTGESGKHDIQNIVTHEIGHFLGFGHEVNPADPEATMYASANAGETKKRTLANNDISVLRLAYAGVGQKFDNQNIHCDIAKDNVGCLAVHSPKYKTQNYVSLLLYLVLTVTLGRWIVRNQE